jgi:hypothetical protein
MTAFMNDLTTSLLDNSEVVAHQGHPSGSVVDIEQDRYGVASTALLNHSGLAGNTKL